MARGKVYKDKEAILKSKAEKQMNNADELFIAPNAFNDDHFDAIKYAARFLRFNGHLDLEEQLLEECGINPIPVFPIEESEFVQRLHAEGLSPHVQGYLRMGEGEDAIRYPIIVLNGDILRYEVFFQKLKSDLREELKAEMNGDT